MNIKGRNSFIALLLLIQTTLGLPAYAQAISINPITPQWNIASIPCSESNNCRVISRVDRNGVLYANLFENRQLFVANPDGSPAMMINLGAAIDSLGAGRFENFVPFEDGTIIFDGPFTLSGYHLYIYNRESNLATQLNLPIPGRLTTCERSPNIQSYPFYRIGNNKLIVCSINSDGVYNINVVNLSSLIVEETILTEVSPDPGLRPWLKLQGGNDGGLYVQIDPGGTGPDFLNGVLIHTPNTYAYVARHTPGAASWTIIPIPTSILSNLPSESDLDMARLVAVDEVGNLYFSILWSFGRNSRTEFVKLSPVGEIIWHITEADFGERRYFVDLPHEDNLVTRANIGLADLELTEIGQDSSVTNTLNRVSGTILTPTTTPTFTPSLN